MKKITILLVFLITINIIAQNTYVPDDNFEQALIDLGYDTVLNNYVLTANINTVTSLDISGLNISNAQGLNGFTALQELNISNNSLTFINFSYSTNLMILDCSNNQLDGLMSLTNNVHLTELRCENNELDSIDLSQNITLTELVCGYNQLTSINTNNNPNLAILNCRNNQISSLDVSQNTILEGLRCDYNQISNIDVGINSLLRYLRCHNNQLTSLNVKNSNNVNFTTFNTTNNPNLTCIEVDDATWSTANWIDIDATSTFAEDCGTTYIPDNNFEQALIFLGYDTVLDDYVLTENINTVDTLFVVNLGIEDLTGIEDFTALTILVCSDNQLTNLDISQNVVLNALDCSNNQLTNLDISQNAVLNGLVDCSNNQLTNLDISQNTALAILICSDNQLTNLELSQNTALLGLICDTNQISSLNVSQNTALEYLECNDNQLTSLNVKNSNNTNFTFFSVQTNPNLTCIEVDDAAWSTINWTDIDATASFSEDCGTASINDLNNQLEKLQITNYQEEEEGINVKTSNGSIIKQFAVYNILGKLLVEATPNQTEFIIQNTNLKKGTILFIKAQLENGQVLNAKFLKY